MPITDIGKIRGLAEKCGATIPGHVIRRFEQFVSNAEEMKKVGIELAPNRVDLVSGIDSVDDNVAKPNQNLGSQVNDK